MVLEEILTLVYRAEMRTKYQDEDENPERTSRTPEPGAHLAEPGAHLAERLELQCTLLQDELTAAVEAAASRAEKARAVPVEQLLPRGDAAAAMAAVEARLESISSPATSASRPSVRARALASDARVFGRTSGFSCHSYNNTRT